MKIINETDFASTMLIRTVLDSEIWYFAFL